MTELSGLLPFPGSMMDDLKPVSARRCDEIAGRVGKALSRVGGVSGVHLFGRVGLPGVSDLDMLLVCEDAAYGNVVARATALTRGDPETAYLFTHQPFVLPVSLLPLRSLLFFEQSLNPVLTLYGDAATAASEPLSPASRRLQDLLWDSTLWRILWLLRSRPYGVREILLLCQTFARQADLRAVHAGAEATLLKTVGPRRRAAASLPFPASAAAAAALLADVTEAWAHGQWEEQARWPALAAEPLVIGDARLPFHHIRGPVVPAMHACVGSRLRRAFAPRLEQPAFAVAAAAPEELEDGFVAYEDAVRRAREWGEANGDPFILFLGHGKGMFPSPFNLAG